MDLQVGQKFTLIKVNDWGMTSFLQGEITRNLDGRLVFKHKGKRKEYYLNKIDEGTLLFDGWDIPFTTDTEAPAINDGGYFSKQIFRGNACFNLVGDEDIIKEWVTTKNLNPEFNKLGHIVLIEGEKLDQERVLFPEMETHHAVIDRIKAQATA